MELDLRLLFAEDFISGLLENGLREDGRSADQMRTITINTGSISTANGSSVVRSGGNCVVCGIKAEFANPSEDHPDRGYMVLNLEMPSMSSPLVAKGYSPTAGVLLQTVNDILISSKFVNLESLCISKGQLCWVLYVDVVCVSVDGLPLDSVLMSVVTALRSTHLPRVELESGKPSVLLDDTSPLSLGHAPTSTTFGLNKRWNALADPDKDELSLCPGLLTIAFTSDSKMAGLFKFGGTQLSCEEIDESIKKAKKLCKSQQKLLQSLSEPAA